MIVLIRGASGNRRNSRGLRVVAVLALAVLMSGGCGPRPQAGGQHGAGALAPDATVRALLAAIDRGEADVVMSLLAPGFTMLAWDGTPLVTRAGYADLLGWDLAAHGERRVEWFEVQGATVALRLEERNRFTALLGLAPFQMEVLYVVRDGRVVEQRLRERTPQGSPSYTERFTAALEPVLAWAESAAPGLLSRATEDGAITYDAATAEALLELIRRYRARHEGRP